MVPRPARAGGPPAAAGAFPRARQRFARSEFARSFGVSDRAVRRYLDLLTGALVVRQLQPWRANIAKRQVRAPKVYLRDTGVLHALLGIGDMRALNTHPKSGASWEGFMLETIVDRLGLPDGQVHFGAHRRGAGSADRARPAADRNRDHHAEGHALDAIGDLDLAEVVVVHAGGDSYRLAADVRAVAARRLDADLKI